MAYLGEEFDASTLPTGGGDYAPLPDGWYQAEIESAELKDTRAGTGKYINVRYRIQGPTHENRVVFDIMNINNPNPKAEEIGRQSMGDLMRAIGRNRISDTDQMIGGQCEIKLKTQPAKDGYDARNKVAGWKASGAAMPKATPSDGAPRQEPAQPAGGSRPPWAQ